METTEISPCPSPDPQPYKHHPLDLSKQQIRLIKLRRGEEGPMQCELRTFDLDDCPAYLALSYTWGPPTPLFEIVMETGKVLTIRENLYRFLQQFLAQGLEHDGSGGEPPQYLWIDQISINQSSTLERNHQVSLMSTIYGEAGGVIIWLASHADDKGKLVEAAKQFQKIGWDLKSYDTIISNNYFSRLWVVQEVLLARSIRVMAQGYTPGWLSWEKLCRQRNISRLYSPADRLHQAYRFGESLLESHSLRSELRRLDDCIQVFSANHCENPRDKVYGLMGIVYGQDRIAIDYTKSVVDVYIDVLLVFCKDVDSFGKPPKMLEKFAMNLALEMGLESHSLNTLESLLSEAFRRRSPSYEIISFGFQPVEDMMQAIASVEDGAEPRTYRWWYDMKNWDNLSIKRWYFVRGAFEGCCSDY